jgi:hypothetical protein
MLITVGVHSGQHSILLSTSQTRSDDARISTERLKYVMAVLHEKTGGWPAAKPSGPARSGELGFHQERDRATTLDFAPARKHADREA